MLGFLFKSKHASHPLVSLSYLLSCLIDQAYSLPTRFPSFPSLPPSLPLIPHLAVLLRKLPQRHGTHGLGQFHQLDMKGILEGERVFLRFQTEALGAGVHLFWWERGKEGGSVGGGNDERKERASCMVSAPYPFHPSLHSFPQTYLRLYLLHDMLQLLGLDAG